jgi:transposase
MSKSKSKVSQAGLGRVNANAAGIDLGSRGHHVALPPDRAVPVRQFGCYTEDLEAMADWLNANRITTVAMESTGVYWVPVFQMLERKGLDVHLVSTRHLKAVPGRKTDVADCQWIQHLHECGLLRGSFRPADAVCVVRAYVRHRDTLGEESARHVQRMQKALEQMNLQLAKVVDDITGETGMAIMDAVLKGERDGKQLAKMRNHRCRKSEEEIARALVGDFREELLFCLRQELEGYRFVQAQMSRCNEEILARLQSFEAKAEAKDIPKAKNKKIESSEIRLALFRAAGVDLSLVPGFGETNLPTLIAEVGFDLAKFTSEKAFASWTTLAPKNFITGGRRKKAHQSAASRVGQVFRMAAQAVGRTKTALGAFYRRMQARKGGAFAVAVTAHKLARLFYRLFKHGETYVEQGVDYYEARYKSQRIAAALKILKTHGLHATLQEIPNAVP